MKQIRNIIVLITRAITLLRVMHAQLIMLKIRYLYNNIYLGNVEQGCLRNPILSEEQQSLCRPLYI